MDLNIMIVRSRRQSLEHVGDGGISHWRARKGAQGM